MARKRENVDLHFPNWGLVNPFRHLFESPRKFNDYVKPGQTVADLGCGPGYFTLALAEHIGESGLVYAIDSYTRAIELLKKRAKRNGVRNIRAFVASAAKIDMIQNESIDFILADGLLCSVAPQDRSGAVSEIKRILKPTGKAYLMASRPPYGYMDKEGWEAILNEFNVEKIIPNKDFTALVSKKIDR